MRLTIRFKLIAAVVAGLLVVSAVAAGLMRFVYARAAAVHAETAIRSAAAGFEAMEKGEIDELALGLVALAANRDLARLLAARDRDGLLKAAQPVFRELRDHARVTHWTFHLPDRTAFLRVHAPGFHGDAVNRATLARAAERKELAAGKELGRTAFAVRAVLPWIVDGELLGFLELGTEIDGFLARLKEQTGDDYALFVDKAHLDPQAWAEVRARAGERNGWDDYRDVVLVNATAPLAWPVPGRLSHDLPAGGEVLAGGERPDEDVKGVFSTRDASGRPVASVVVEHGAGALASAFQEVRGRVVLTVVLLAGGLAALIVFMLDTLVFERLRRMSDLLERLPERMARGEYRLEEPLEPPPDDELGRFEGTFHRAVEVIGGALREIEHGRERGGRGPTIRPSDRP